MVQIWEGEYDEVSIHAPPNRKERRPVLPVCLQVSVFQSTPLPTGRSDVAATDRAGRQRVSIHAPPNRKERPGCFDLARVHRMFQSTPLPTGRSDSR